MSVRKLRAVQIFCLVLALSACWLVAHSGKPKNNGEIGPIQWVIVLAAVYCALSGLTLQRKITKGPSRPRPTKTASTPSSRWGVGHLFRLASACSVAMWGAIIPICKGPLWLAYVLCGLGILLLLVWSPGTEPGAKPFGKTA